MAFDTIFQNATYIKWFYRNVVNTTTSQSGVTLVQDPAQKTSDTVLTRTVDGPKFRRIEFTVGAPQGLKYSENRALIEDIYNHSNVNATFEICFGNLTNLAYITPYAGNVTQANIDNRSVQFGDVGPRIDNNTNKPVVNLTISSGSYPQLADGDMMFKAGDFFMPGANVDTSNSNAKGAIMYGTVPLQFENDILISGSHGSTRKIVDSSGLLPDNYLFVNRTHRPVSSVGTPITAAYLEIGSNVVFSMKPKKIPSYNIVPHDLIEFNGDFVFEEVMRGAD